MNEQGRPMRALVWAELEQAEFAGALCKAAGLNVSAAGSPNAAKSDQMARLLGTDVQVVSDLRAGFGQAEVDVVLLCAPGDFCDGQHDGDDLSALEAARLRGMRIFALEPMPGSLLQLESPRLISGSGDEQDGRRRTILEAAGVRLGPGDGSAAIGDVPTSGEAAVVMNQGGWAAFASSMRLSASMREARELLDHFGVPATCVVEAMGTQVQGSLGARLFDAMDLVESMMGTPETCSAACVLAGPLTGVRLVPGDKLRGLHGSLNATLRYSDGRWTNIIASDQAGCWSRSVTLMSSKGRMRIYDGGFDWIGPEGKSVDFVGKGGGQMMDGVSAIASHIRRSLDARSPMGVPSDFRKVLAATGAMLLSCRTGESESPGTILRMASGG